MTDRNDPDYFYVDAKLPDYLNNILEATRSPAAYGLPEFEGELECGAPAEDFERIMHFAKQQATRAGRKYMMPEDIRGAVEQTLPLTLILSQRAEAEGREVGDIVRRILDFIETP